MELPIKSEWLADLLMGQKDLITECWIEDIRAAGIQGYNHITDEQLLAELPPTVDSMIYAFRTGDTEGPRKHSLDVIQHRLREGFLLTDLQMSLHALETAVMRIVKRSNLGPVKEFEALMVASNMYYLVALIAAAVYEQLRAEQQRRFTAAYEFGITLSRDLDLRSILDTAVTKTSEYVGGDSVAILLAGPEGSRDELQAYYNLDADLVETIPDITESIGCGVTNADSQSMFETTCTVPDVRETECLSEWTELLVSHGRLSIVCAPLLAKQKRLGSVVMMWSEVHTAPGSELDFLFAMAGHIANAIQNAILYEEAKGKWELGILLNSSKLFASSLDTQDILRKIARMATEAVRADLAIVFTKDHLREHSHNAFYARSRKATNAVRRIVDAVVSEGEESGYRSLGQDFARGKAILYQTSDEFPGKMQSLAGIGASGMVVPLRRKNILLGAFTLVSLAPNAFTEEDLVLATGLSDMAAVAIENARLYEYERNIAETLQRSFLPASLPSIEGYETAAYYRPARPEADIGGDFYDIFTTGEGDIGVLIGDVSGKGLVAAVPTVMGKYTVHAYAAENPSPGSIMTRFNRTFYKDASEGLYMTAFYGILNPRDNTFTYASAGHNPPLLYSSASDQVTEIYTSGLCLGVTADVEHTEHKIELQPGDVLLLFTDGATDAKSDDSRLEVEGLQELLRSCAHGSAEEIVQSIADGIWDFSHGNLPDDVALVVLKRVEDASCCRNLDE